MDLGLADRRVVVTGGSSGIGAAAARLLALEGARVVIAARRRGALEAAAEEISVDARHTVGVVEMDVMSGESIATGIHQALARLNGLDVLVHAAGGSTLTDAFRARDAAALPIDFAEDGSWTLRRGLDLASDEDWIRLYELNVVSLVRLIRVCRPHLASSDQGRVIAVASSSGRERGAGQWEYHVAKAAEIATAHCLAAELRDDGILVNAVCPSATDSLAALGLREVLTAGSGRSSVEVFRELYDGLPFNRPAHVDEVAGMICFLASRHASYISGATLPVDGGSTNFLL